MGDVQETARLYFEGEDVTINLIWSALVVGALVLLLKPLFGIPLLDNILGAMTGGHGHSPSYGGGVSSGYGAPDAGYGAPAAGYGAPDAGYGAPSDSYDTPDSGYSAPQSGYSRGRRSVSLSEDQKSLYNILKPLSEVEAPLLANLALKAPVAPSLELAQLS